MKFLGLLSGGKDSLYAVGKAMSMGHQLVCAANLYSPQEADSFMFQTSGTTIVPAIAESLGIPLIHRRLRGSSSCKTLTYSVTEKDEVEDLYELVLEAKYRFPEIQAVVSGAVFSDYQRIRVEHVCSRLGLSSISPLWRKDQKDLLLEMREDGYESVIVKISSMGLQEKHLGQRISENIEYFEGLHKKFGFNMAGEGGEYETLIIDAPIMNKKLLIEESEKVVTGNSAYSPYGHLIIKKLALQDKSTGDKTEFKENYSDTVKVFKRHAEVFVGEITAKHFNCQPENFEHEVFTVLKGTKDLLEQEGLDLTCIYYLTAYIKRMEDFVKFNGVYSKFFSFPNPPSRVCVELGQQESGLKISFKGTLSKKKCTHVQSISNWAPASIGPYSQSYLINSALHLAGSIPLVPSSMTLSEDSVNQAISNCAAVAKVNDFSLDSTELCIVYYTNEKPVIPKPFFPFFVKVTNLPRAASVELELHLQKNLPALQTLSSEVSTDLFKVTLSQVHCTALVNLNWFIEIHEAKETDSLIDYIYTALTNYFLSVTHKSGVSKGQLLGSEDIVLDFSKYINEIRVYAPDPYEFKKGFIEHAPSVYLNSETRAIFIQMQDFLQIGTYQFINSGN